MHGTRWTLVAGARNQINKTNYQLYLLRRCLELHYSSSKDQEHLISANVYELKSMLDVAPHVNDFHRSYVQRGLTLLTILDIYFGRGKFTSTRKVFPSLDAAM